MQVTDPVCGMQIDSAKAEATEVVEGQTYYFCSTSCHDKFQANPGQYAKQQGAKPEAPGHRC